MIVIKEFDKKNHHLIKEEKINSFDELYHYPDNVNHDILIESDLWEQYKGLFNQEVDNENDFNNAILNVVWYLNSEFDNVHENEVLTNLSCVSLAYTTGELEEELLGVDEYDYQVTANLIEHTLTYSYNDMPVKVEAYGSLQKLNECVLEGLQFDYLLDELNNEELVNVLIETTQTKIKRELAQKLVSFSENVDYFNWLDNLEGSYEEQLKELEFQLDDFQSLQSIYNSLQLYDDEDLTHEESQQLTNILQKLELYEPELKEEGMSL